MTVRPPLRLLFWPLAIGALLPSGPAAAAETERRLAIVAINDVYRVTASAESPEGGLARVATLARDLERHGYDVVVTLAGDFVSPSLETTLGSGGMHMIEALNAVEGEPGGSIRVVVSLGNHEFDLKPKDFCPAFAAARFTIVMADQAMLPACEPALTLPVWTDFAAGGRQVCATGSLGMLAPEVKSGAAPTDLATLASTAPAACDTRVVLTHQNMADDLRLSDALSASSKGKAPFTVILGGHEHTGLARVTVSPWVLKAPSDARRAFVLTWDRGDEPQRLDVALIGDTPGEAPDVRAIGERWHAERLAARGLDQSLWSEAIWKALPVELEGEETALRERETTLANLVADAAAASAPGAVAIVNVGSLRLGRDIPAGSALTVGHLVETDLFNAPLVSIADVSPEDLAAIVQDGFAEWPGSGRFPAISSNLSVQWTAGTRATATLAHPAQKVVLITSEYMCLKSEVENPAVARLCRARASAVKTLGTVREVTERCVRDDACRAGLNTTIGQRRLTITPP